MKFFRNIPTEVNAKFLAIDIAVRYDEEDMPKDAPLRDGDSWRAVIDLDTHRIEDWPQGKTLEFNDMKVCDEGEYTLLDANRNALITNQGYVPNNLLPGAYGDYLSLNIDETGLIINWLPDADLSDFEEDSPE